MTPFLYKVILVSIILASQSNPDSDVGLLYMRKYVEHCCLFVWSIGVLVYRPYQMALFQDLFSSFLSLLTIKQTAINHQPVFCARP